ncbi:MAG TPA: hypothetical protein VNX17_12070 [Edaphobacter sp.]|nr:hypothetical protein [Edaphobacter sp.]
MNINGTTLIAIVAAPLIIGSLLGAPPAAQKPKPAPAPKGTNLIRLEIDPTGKVVLAPQANDIVEWFVQPTKNHPTATAAYVSFPGFSPCQGNPGDTLTYCFVQKEGDFNFECDSRNPCVDPGMDPRSQSGTILQAIPASTPRATPAATPAAAAAVATEPPPLARIRIDCDNQYPKPAVEPISVLNNQKIPWFSDPQKTFTITTAPKNFCAEDTGAGIESYRGLAVCKATGASGTSATYTVQGACPNSDKTFNISVK